MPLRTAAAALAASAVLIAPSAAADPEKTRLRGGVSVDLGDDVRLTLASGGRGYDRGYDRAYGRYDTRDLRRAAVQQCRAAIRREGYDRGFRDVDFDGRRVRQIGPAGFLVRFDMEFEGRRREFERDVTCEVRRGRIVALEGVPYPGGRRAYAPGRPHGH